MKSISLLLLSQKSVSLSYSERDKSMARSAKWRLPFMFSDQNLKFYVFPIISLYITYSVNGIFNYLITMDLSQDIS